MSLLFLHEGDIFEDAQGLIWIRHERIYTHVQYHNSTKSTLAMNDVPTMTSRLKFNTNQTQVLFTHL